VATRQTNPNETIRKNSKQIMLTQNNLMCVRTIKQKNKKKTKTKTKQGPESNLISLPGGRLHVRDPKNDPTVRFIATNSVATGI
jgi:hypothetical protein